MDWRINSSKAASAAELRSHLESEAIEVIRMTCQPVKEDPAAGLLSPKFVEDANATSMRLAMSTAIDALCLMANSLEKDQPGVKLYATLSDVMTPDGGRRIGLFLDEALEPAFVAAEPIVFSDDKPNVGSL